MSNKNRFGYKAYDPGLKCRNYQYAENEVFKKNGHGVCVPGVTHYCVNPFDVLDYYPLVRDDGKFSDFTSVEAIDDPVTDDNKKFATSTIKIGAKQGLNGFVKACVDFTHAETIKNMPKSNDNPFDDAGNGAKIESSKNYARIGSAGDYARIGSYGYAAKIGCSGDYAQMNVSGKDSVCAAIGIDARIKANIGNWITLAEWEHAKEGKRLVPLCVKSAKVDGERIKANTWYKLENGEFVEAKD